MDTSLLSDLDFNQIEVIKQYAELIVNLSADVRATINQTLDSYISSVGDNKEVKEEEPKITKKKSRRRNKNSKKNEIEAEDTSTAVTTETIDDNTPEQPETKETITLSSSYTSNNTESESDLVVEQEEYTWSFKDDDFPVAQTTEEINKFQQDIDLAHSILSNHSRELLSYCYEIKCNRNVNDLIEFLVDKPDDEINALKVEYEKDHRKKQESEKYKNLIKKSIISKHEYKAQLPMYDDKGKPLGHPIKGKSIKPNVFITVNPELGGGVVKNRFRDGVIVTKRGEKKVDVTPKSEEYDGGSRGSVQQKGKRGPGWVKG